MTFNWNDQKNEFLKTKRNISFEEIILCISENKVIKILDHPNTRDYPNQKLYLIEYKDYIYVVPFVIDKLKNEFFLKTIFRNRKYTKKYLRKKGEINE